MVKALGIQVFYGTAKLIDAQSVEVLLTQSDNENPAKSEQSDEMVR